MANATAHRLGAAAVVSGVALAAENNQEEPTAKPLVAGSLAWLAGTLPDILEPARHPNHRQFFHSLAFAGLVGHGVYKAWKWEPGEMPIEYDAPDVVPSNEVTFLMPYGSVFFATAPLIEKELPSVTDDTRNAVIALGLRGEEDLGSTFLEVLERYALDLNEHNSKLMLVGVASLTKDQLEQTKIDQTIGRENIFVRTDKIGEAATQAWDAAQKWLAEQLEPEPVPEEIAPEEVEIAAPRKGFFRRIGQIWRTGHTEDAAETPPEETQEDQTD